MALALKKNTCPAYLNAFTEPMRPGAAIKAAPAWDWLSANILLKRTAQSIHVRSTPDIGTSVGFTLETKKD